MFGSRRRREQELADARADAQRWYEALGGQVMNLPPGESAATRQALIDAGERYNAAGSQLHAATTTTQFALARQTAMEGLHYTRAARVSLGFDPGPPLPPLSGQPTGAIRQDREVQVQGRNYRASSRPGDATPYYYPGGTISGRPVPSGWYSEPWWKTALVAGAWGIGTAMVFDALLAPAWGDYGYGGYGAGYDQGFAAGDNQGYDQGYDQGYQQGVDQQQDQQQYDDGGQDGGDQQPDYGGEGDSGGFDSGGYDNGGFDSGGSDNSGFDNSGFDNSGFDSGGFDGGGFDGGGFDGGGFDGGGFDGGF